MNFSPANGFSFSMIRASTFRRAGKLLACFLVFGLLSACASVKYSAFEKIGIHKRDLLVDNVEDTRDAQKEAQEQFKDALEKFGSVVTIEETGLKKAYNRLSDEYEDSVDAAEDVSDNINDVQEVAEDLFTEWKKEIGEAASAGDIQRQRAVFEAQPECAGCRFITQHFQRSAKRYWSPDRTNESVNPAFRCLYRRYANLVRTS